MINTALFTQRSFLIPADKTTLICGPSIFKSGINPALLPGSINISQDEELYPMTKIKLKKVLADNQHIHHVILAINPGLISKKLELLAVQNPVFEKEIIERLYPISSPEDYALWPIGQKTVRQVFFQQYALPNTPYLKGTLLDGDCTDHRYFPYIGTFKSKDKSKLKESLERVIRRLTPADDEESQPSPFLIQGLKDCLALCAERKITVTLVSTPIHEAVRAITPEAVMARYTSLTQECIENGISVLDLSDIPLSDDAYFNATHLNQTGARRFTTELANRLNIKNK